MKSVQVQRKTCERQNIIHKQTTQKIADNELLGKDLTRLKVTSIAVLM